MCSGFWKDSSEQHVKWNFLLARNGSMFDTPNRKVPVNFFWRNFQDIIFTPSRVDSITQKWFRDHLKKWPFFGPDPLHSRRETTNTTTMAVAPKNGPLPPHMKSNFRCIWVGLIGDNASSKRICFSPAMSRSNALKMLPWCGDDGDESCLAIGAFWGL